MTHLSYAGIAIPFELVNGLIIVEAEINGTLGNYIVDSGSNGILLNAKSDRSEVSYQTLTSTLEGSETVIELVKVGDFEMRELLAFSTDLSNIETYLDKQINGILGCSIFTPNSLGFDFGNSEMIISESGDEKIKVDELTSLSYEMIEDLPMIDIKIGGEVHTFILDSGASSHFIDKKVLDAISSSASRTGNEKDIVTAGGENQVSAEFIIPNCTLGNQKTSLKAYEKDFKLISQTLDKNISGLISLSKLSKELVFFDLQAKKFYFKTI